MVWEGALGEPLGAAGAAGVPKRCGGFGFSGLGGMEGLCVCVCVCVCAFPGLHYRSLFPRFGRPMARDPGQKSLAFTIDEDAAEEDAGLRDIVDGNYVAHKNNCNDIAKSARYINANKNCCYQ